MEKFMTVLMRNASYHALLLQFLMNHLFRLDINWATSLLTSGKVKGKRNVSFLGEINLRYLTDNQGVKYCLILGGNNRGRYKEH